MPRIFIIAVISSRTRLLLALDVVVITLNSAHRGAYHLANSFPRIADTLSRSAIFQLARVIAGLRVGCWRAFTRLLSHLFILIFPLGLQSDSRRPTATLAHKREGVG